jgi:FkbM family methyltransferase
MNIRNFIKNPQAYFKRIPLSLVGLYFDLCIRKYKADNCVFYIPKKHTSLYERGFSWLHGYEKPERLLISKYLPADSTVLELGGCIGVVSCIINKKLAFPNNHIVIEPNKNIVPHLMENRNSNACKFIIENCLISKYKNVSFTIHPNMLLSGINKADGEVVECLSTTPEELEKKYEIDFNFIVMDIEGDEQNFIPEFEDYLSKNIKAIIFEEHPDVVSLETRKYYANILTMIGFHKVDQIGNVSCYLKKSP